MVTKIVKEAHNYDSNHVLVSCGLQIGFTVLFEHRHYQRKLFILDTQFILNETNNNFVLIFFKYFIL